MANIFIYHPDTDATVAVPEESVWHYRQGGWLTRAEWDQLQAEAAEREAKAAAEQAAAERPAVRNPVAVAAKKE